jgi:two-component system OmpR family sensor kinase
VWIIGGRQLALIGGSSAPGPPVVGLVAVYDDAGDVSQGINVPTLAEADGEALTKAQMAAVKKVPDDGEMHDLEIHGVGSFRVRTQQVRTNTGTSLTAVTGLNTEDLDSTLSDLLLWEILLSLVGVGLAFGGGQLLVRRTLAPLRQVADAAQEVTRLQLDTGSVGQTVRVPDNLTDQRTEVGRVGASLNSLLGHVEGALDARHRSEQQVRQFVGDASHELRTPLATIHGYAELSRRTPDDPVALSGALAKVETEADRMSGLVEDLLLLARLDAGRPLERAEVDVTRLLLESVVDARVLSPAHRWRLDLPEEPVTVTGDEQRLHQVVTNLLSNARQHTPPGTLVTVSARESDDEVRIVVHDNGPGLPEGLASNAFERFSRGDSSRTRASGGVGLGLSLVAAIAQAHGGSAHVESQPGSTTFTVVLPR